MIIVHYVISPHICFSDSTVIVTSTGTLLISTLDPADSKNYTCTVPNNNIKRRDTTYVHNVLGTYLQIINIINTSTMATIDNTIITNCACSTYLYFRTYLAPYIEIQI